MYDINYDNIVEFCRENDIEVIGRIPFNPKVLEAMINRKTIIEYSPESDTAKEIERIWGGILIIILSKRVVDDFTSIRASSLKAFRKKSRDKQYPV